MFENIIEQGAVTQLKDDILSGNYPPSMLFYGPSETGKGSAALELARVLSCSENAQWKCTCPSCERYRYLQSEDLLMLGKKSFSAETAACSSVFIKNPSSQSAKLLFFRSLRKLQTRFSSVLMEDDPKFSKLSSVLQSLDEKLNELLEIKGEEIKLAEKLSASLLKDAVTLNDEGFGSFIPTGHIRNASYWCRLAPNGKRKVLIIENSSEMRDEARNSLLKLLEEPPPSVNIVLTSQRREAVIPTILSRCRQYRFIKRSAEGEREVLRRVFQEGIIEETSAASGSLVTSYLESFLSQKCEKLRPLAIWFTASIARIAVLAARKSGSEIPAYVTALGNRYAPEADSLGFERIVKIAPLVKALTAKSGGFENDTFSGFIRNCLDLFADISKENCNAPDYIAYNDKIKKLTDEAVSASDILNVNTALVLEALIFNLKNMLVKG